MPLTKPYPKMYRHGPSWTIQPFLEDIKSPSGVNNLSSYELLKHDLRTIFEFIEPNPANDIAYSHRNYELLLRACTEVESLCKQIFKANNILNAENIKRFSDLNGPMKLSEFTVRSYGFIYPEFKPFESFSYPNRDLRSPNWYKAYNDVKHKRHDNFAKASLKNVIEAAGGVYVLLVSMYGLGFDHILRHSYAGGIKDVPTFFRTPKLPEWPEEEKYEFKWDDLKNLGQPYHNHLIPIIP